MFVRKLRTGMVMTAREIFRSRYIVALIVAMPLIFFLMIFITSNDHELPILLGMASDHNAVVVNEREESLLFFGAGAISLIAAFIALKLTQQHQESCRRLIVCGYSTSEMLLSRVGMLLLTLVPLGAYVVGLLLCFFQPNALHLVLAGFILAGFVYAALGAFVGVLFRSEIEGVLAVLLVANIDAVWMQNPVYYTATEHREIIRALPAYFPTQVCMISAFTEESVLVAAAGSILYGALLLTFALVIYWWRMRVL